MTDDLLTTPAGRRRLETVLLPAWLAQQRWFGGKGRGLRGVRIARAIAIGPATLFAVETQFDDGATETYAVPLLIARTAAPPPAILERFDDGRAVLDAAQDADFRAALFLAMRRDPPPPGLAVARGPLLREQFAACAVPESRVLAVEQSNTSIVYGGRIVVKLYRKLVPGANPDAEMTHFLSERAHFPNVPAFAGSIAWDGCAVALGMAKVESVGDGWSLALEEMRRFFDGAPGGARLSDWWNRTVGLLGQATGGMHLTLARAQEDGFAPEPFTAEDSALLADALSEAVRETCAALAARWDGLRGAHPLIERVLAEEPRLSQRACAVHDLRPPVIKTRIHGDYHLGQVLLGAHDWVLLDFEGEPARTLAERRAKQCPFRDVAGMLRSFHYAAHANGITSERGIAQAEEWAGLSQAVFRASWQAAVAPAVKLSLVPADSRRLLDAFILEKTLYEVRYELNNRPGWLHIPLRGLLAC